MDKLTKNITPENQNYKCRVETPSGVIHCDKDPSSPITLHGYLPHFAQYLHESGQLKDFIDTCPLEYTSNNAPKVKDVLGTAILSILSGHSRYSHIASLYGDKIAAELLGMNKIVSHDSLTGGLKKLDNGSASKWLQKSFLKQYEPLLTTPYILDIDPTVKVLYGHQQGGEIGYNPQKPGRRSHAYHTYFIGTLRLVLDMEIHPGNETAGKYSLARLWELLDTMPGHCRPRLIRGDIAFGNERAMIGCEHRNLEFLFKLKQSVKVKNLISELNFSNEYWHDAGQGWQGREASIQLRGWSKSRRVVVLRRLHTSKKKTQKSINNSKTQLELPFVDIVDDECAEYEYQVLVTSCSYDIMALSQLYRDRADCENVFDELKNEWGWGGFNSQNLDRTQIMASLTALVYNWWNIYCRLMNPDKHLEAKTSRPQIQSVVGRMIRTGGARRMYLTAIGSAAEEILLTLASVSRFISELGSTTTQLNCEQKWVAILREAFKKFWDQNQIMPVSEGRQFLLPI